jgi:hypothetical protein
MSEILSNKEPSESTATESLETIDPIKADDLPENSAEASSATREATEASDEKATAKVAQGGSEDGESLPEGLGDAGKKALQSERKRARDLERQVAELQAQFQKAQAQGQAPAKEPSSEDVDAKFWENPRAFVQAERDAIAQQMRAEITKTRVDAFEAAARTRHEDFDAASAAFTAVARQHQQLIAQMLAAPDPAEFAYQMGKQALFATEIGSDPEAYRQRLRAEWEAERSGEPGESKRPVKVPPKTIAGARGNGSSASHAWSGPRSMKDILRG